MNKLIWMLASVVLLSGVTVDAMAQGQSDKAKANKETLRESDERALERIEEAQEDAAERSEEARERAEEAAERGEITDDDRERGRDNAATRGNEKSQEMRARRDERKEIMEEHKSAQSSDGDELLDGDLDATQQAEEAKQKKAKKPWWKFWGD